MESVDIKFPSIFEEVSSISEQSAEKNPASMTDQQIREIMEAAPLLRQMLEEVEKEAFSRLNSGKSIEGLKLVNGRGSREWALDEEEIAKKLQGMGIPKSSIYETKLISIAKLEKLSWDKKGETKKLTERQLKTVEQEYVTKKSGKLSVALSSDNRPAVILDASPMFGEVSSNIPDWLKQVI